MAEYKTSHLFQTIPSNALSKLKTNELKSTTLPIHIPSSLQNHYQNSRLAKCSHWCATIFSTKPGSNRSSLKRVAENSTTALFSTTLSSKIMISINSWARGDIIIYKPCVEYYEYNYEYVSEATQNTRTRNFIRITKIRITWTKWH